MNDNTPLNLEQRLKENSTLVRDEILTSNAFDYILKGNVRDFTYETWALLTYHLLVKFKGKNIEFRPYLPNLNPIFAQYAFNVAKELCKNENNGLIPGKASWLLTIILAQSVSRIQFAATGNGPLGDVDKFVSQNEKLVKNTAAKNISELTNIYFGCSPGGKKPGFFSSLF
jgi:hypothetical protein